MKKSAITLLILLIDCFLVSSQNKNFFSTEGYPVTGSGSEFKIIRDLISNGDFTTYDSACIAIHSLVQPCPDPFQSGCINSWNASHGSPEFSIHEHATILGAVKSNGYHWGEGIFQELNQNLDSGMFYLLIFNYQLKSSCVIKKSYLTVQFTDQEFHPGTCFEMEPANGWKIPDDSFPVIQNQKTAVIFFKSGVAFNKIWFTHINEDDSVSWVEIRSIHLFPVYDFSPKGIINLFRELNSEENLGIQLFLSEQCGNKNRVAVFTTNPCLKE